MSHFIFLFGTKHEHVHDHNLYNDQCYSLNNQHQPIVHHSNPEMFCTHNLRHHWVDHSTNWCILEAGDFPAISMYPHVQSLRVQTNRQCLCLEPHQLPAPLLMRRTLLNVLHLPSNTDNFSKCYLHWINTGHLLSTSPVHAVLWHPVARDSTFRLHPVCWAGRGHMITQAEA